MQPVPDVQFWLSTADSDVVDRLKVFTFLSRSEIEGYAELVATEPFRRAAQKRLALEVVATVHGIDAAAAVIAASEALFGQGDLTALDAQTLRTALEELPNATVATGTPVVDVLVATGLVASLSEARRAIAQGGVTLDGNRVEDETATVQAPFPGECPYSVAARRPLPASSSAEPSRFG